MFAQSTQRNKKYDATTFTSATCNKNKHLYIQRLMNQIHPIILKTLNHTHPIMNPKAPIDPIPIQYHQQQRENKVNQQQQ